MEREIITYIEIRELFHLLRANWAADRALGDGFADLRLELRVHAGRTDRVDQDGANRRCSTFGAGNDREESFGLTLRLGHSVANE